MPTKMQLAVAIDVNFAIVNKVDLFKASSFTGECRNMWYSTQKPCSVHLATFKYIFVSMQGKISQRNVSVNGDIRTNPSAYIWISFVSRQSSLKKANEIKTKSCYDDIL